MAAGTTGVRPADDPPSLIGSYTILRLLGSGAMGQVYLGQDQHGAQAAVKVLKSSNAEQWRFTREAELLGGDFGDAVATLLDADLGAAPPWFAMEYLPGMNLQQRVDRHGPLSMRTTAAVGMRLADGLATLHRSGIAHRDLKPSNVMIRDSGDPVIIDFGLASDSQPTETGDRTATNNVVGTVHWMAPEYAQGDRSDFYRADLYSLGATLAYAASGVHPRTTSKFLSLDGVDEALAPVLRELLRHNPSRRPSAATCAKRFAAVAEEGRTLGHSIADMEAELSTGAAPRADAGQRVPPSVANARAAAQHIEAIYTKTKDLV